MEPLDQELNKPSRAAIAAGNICYFFSVFLTMWFIFFCWVWVYGAALFIAYPAAVLAFILWGIGTAFDPNRKRYKNVAIALLIGVIISVSALLIMIYVD